MAMFVVNATSTLAIEDSSANTKKFDKSYIKNIEISGTNVIKPEEILEKITGEIVDLFRPPFGVTNPNVGKVVEELNLKTIGWNIRSLDTNMSQDRLQVAERVSQKLTGKDIILLHDDRQGSEILLEALLKNIEKLGHKVTLL